MSEMMNALVLTEYKKLVYRQVPKPAIQANEVLIRVKACGICGSDIHGYDGHQQTPQHPIFTPDPPTPLFSSHLMNTMCLIS